MSNRVVMRICGEEFTFIAEEPSNYMQRVGAYVGEKMQEILSSSKVGRTDAAVLTAVNIADELFKMQETDEQLRGQIKGYLDESARAKAEISELKREVLRLQKLQKKLETAVPASAPVGDGEASDAPAEAAPAPKPKARSTRSRAKKAKPVEEPTALEAAAIAAAVAADAEAQS